jgi:hypothetical protein
MVAVLGALGAMLWAGHARAFCREVTMSPPSTWDPVMQGCFGDGMGLPTLYWRNQCAGYSIQKDASKQVPLADATRVAAQAFAAWTGASCPNGGSPSIFPSPLPPVSCNTTPSQEHNNPIIFRDSLWPHGDRSNTLGYTTLTVDLTTGEIFGADIEINTHDYTIVASGTPMNGAYDLASVLTHEAGHFLGLAHSGDKSAIMYAFYMPGSAALTPDDVSGICSLYPADGSRSTQNGTASVAATTCSPTPQGFRDDCGSLDSGVSSVGSGSPPSPGDGGADGGDPRCSYNLLSCAVGHASPSGGAGASVVGGSMMLAAIVRRARRRARTDRESRQGAKTPSKNGPEPGYGTVGTGATLLALLAVTAIGIRDARASVAVIVPLEELVQKASAAAVVTPTEQRAVWEDHRIVTYTRVHVDRVVAGVIAGDAWVRTRGGAVGKIGQIVEGEATLAPGRQSLVFLRPNADAGAGTSAGPYAVVEGAQGQFPVVVGEDQRPRLSLARDLGVLVPALRRDGGAPLRLARDVLPGRDVDDAAREIATLWRRAH